MEQQKVVVVESEMAIPRSEAGTQEKATPGMVVVEREKQERRKSEAEHKSREE